MQNKKTPLRLVAGMSALMGFLCGCAPDPPENKQPMSQGEKLYRANCASCHSLLAPKEHDGPTWEAYIEKYGQRLSPEEKQLVYDFLTGQEEPVDDNDG